MKTLLSLIVLVSLFSLFTACSKNESAGTKVTIRNTSIDSSNAIFEGVIENSQTENFSGLTFIQCGYAMEGTIRGSINVVVPRATANAMSVGDTLYFIRTAINSSALNVSSVDITTPIKSYYIGVYLGSGGPGTKNVHRLK